MTFTNIRRKNSVYYRSRRRAIGSHSRWGERNQDGLSSPGESLMTAEARKNIRLPCGTTVAQSWGAIRKCWLGFYITKSRGDLRGMQEYAYRIRKIQIQMGIKRTVFDPGIIDENTAMLIDLEYRSQAPKNQELKMIEESRNETTELNYEVIMTGSSPGTKMPDPRENIFTTYNSSGRKSCLLPAEGPLANVEKKVINNNNSCYTGPPKQVYSNQVRVDRHVTYSNSQCPSRPLKRDQNNFAAPDPNQPPISLIFEDNARAQQDRIHLKHENKAYPYEPSESRLQRSKKHKVIRRRSKSCPYVQPL